MRRVGHRVWWSGARQEADTQALRRVVGPIPGPHAGRKGMLRRDHDPAAPAVRARVNSRDSAVWPPASAIALLRRQLQHPIVGIEGDVEVAGGVHRDIQGFAEAGERQHGLSV
jgi:hypothetical protein